MFMKYIKVIIQFWDTRWIILSKSLLFGQNGLRKSAWWRPPDTNKNSKIVKRDRQNVYEVHQCNFQGLFINLGLLGGSFWQKVHFFVKMDSGNQPGDVPLNLTKKQKLLKMVDRMFMKHIKVIIRDYLSILGYQMDHFVKKNTFWSKWTPEISPVTSP